MTAPKARDKHGRYPIPHPDTRELIDLPGWTKLKNLLYSGGLETWKLKKVAAAVAKSTALQLQAADPDQCYAAVRKALAAETDAADIGTMIHKHCEEIDRDTLNEDFVGVAAKPWLDHYRQAKAVYGWQMVEAEVTVCNHTLGYAGTADRFLRFDSLPRIGGGTFCVDMKTGKDVYKDTALQLRAYAGGEWIFEPYDLAADPEMSARRAQLEQDIASGTNIPAGRRKWSDAAIRQARAELEEEESNVYAARSMFRAMPADIRFDYGLVIHLTADGCQIVPVALDGAIEQVAHLASIYRWQNRTDVVGPPLEPGEPAALPAEPVVSAPDPFARTEPPAVDRRQQLEVRWAWLKAQSTLGASDVADWWVRSGIPTLKSDRPIDDEQIDRILEVMSRTEAAFGVPFEPSTRQEIEVDEAIDRLEQAFDAHAEDADPAELRDLLAATVDKIASTRPHLLAGIKARKERLGLTKRLRHDDWTVDELLQLAAVVNTAGE